MICKLLKMIKKTCQYCDFFTIEQSGENEKIKFLLIV